MRSGKCRAAVHASVKMETTTPFPNLFAMIAGELSSKVVTTLALLIVHIGTSVSFNASSEIDSSWFLAGTSAIRLVWCCSTRQSFEQGS